MSVCGASVEIVRPTTPRMPYPCHILAQSNATTPLTKKIPYSLPQVKAQNKSTKIREK